MEGKLGKTLLVFQGNFNEFEFYNSKYLEINTSHVKEL